MVSKKIQCAKCRKKCSGNVLRYQERYYHKNCFDLDEDKTQSASNLNTLSSNSNISVDKMHNNNNSSGTTSHIYNYKKEDTTCSNCAKTSDYSSTKSPNGTISPINGAIDTKRPNCAGCHELIQDGQALIALDTQWHVWCFKCTKCSTVLHGEYVAKEGQPYCEKDYQKLYGVSCVHCKRYITGKVLQAGENHHFHPSCARCSKCGDPFVPGEEMYLQGEVIWHPRCGPGPDSNIEDIIVENVLHDVTQYRNDRNRSPSLSSGRSRSRSASPYSYMSRQHGRSLSGFSESEPLGDLSRIYTCSYLTSEPSQGYLRRPIEPNPPKSPQFSRPMNLSSRSNFNRSRSSSRSGLMRDRSLPRTGMNTMLESLRSTSPRPRSPISHNDEPIELSQFPAGQRPQPDDVAKIERDDFPAPPYPYTDDRHKRGNSTSRLLSEQSIKPASSKASSFMSKSNGTMNIVDDSDEDDDNLDEDPQLKREEEELSKIATGIGKIFLKTVKERERFRAWKRANLDPRASSRTPSAVKEPLTNQTRSRDTATEVWDNENHQQEDLYHGSSQATRSSFGRSQLGSLSNYRIASSSVGIDQKSTGYNSVQNHAINSSSNYYGTYSSDKNQSSDILSQTNPYNHHIHNHNSHGINYPSSKSRPTSTNSQIRRSMPNVNFHFHSDAPPKLYPYHLLITSNYRLPPDIDRCHLERHLSNEEFQYIFHCDRLDFYRMPEWKRNELKRRAKLF